MVPLEGQEEKVDDRTKKGREYLALLLAQPCRCRQGFVALPAKDCVQGDVERHQDIEDVAQHFN